MCPTGGRGWLLWLFSRLCPVCAYVCYVCVAGKGSLFGVAVPSVFQISRVHRRALPIVRHGILFNYGVVHDDFPCWRQSRKHIERSIQPSPPNNYKHKCEDSYVCAINAFLLSLYVQNYTRVSPPHSQESWHGPILQNDSMKQSWMQIFAMHGNRQYACITSSWEGLGSGF